MSIVCYYCDERGATTRRYDKPICNECNSKIFRTSAPPKERTVEQKATMLKLCIAMDKIAEEQRNGTRERIRPKGM